MRFLQHVSIKRKLMLIMMLTTIAALLLAAGVFVVYDRVTFRRSMVNDLAILAEIIGANSTAALTFNDPASAQETLAGLAAEPHILSAGIYAADGKLFASWTRPAAGEGPALHRRPEAHYSFLDDRLDLCGRITLDRETLGGVCLQTDLQELRIRLGQHARIVVMVILGSSLVALALSSLLQRIVSTPVLNLARTARVVSNDKDYSVRVRREGEDEIGELIDAFNEMLGEVQHRDAALQKRRDELEAANKELAAFSYSVSHDLRSPLRSIDGFSQALLEDYDDKLDAEGRDYLHRVRNATHRMAQLIDDLLELAQVSRGEMRHEVVDLSAMAESIAAELRQSDPDRNVVFSIVPGLVVKGDQRLLRVAFANLLGNAWKFTSKRAVALVTLGADSHGEQTIYWIRDDGAGFDPAYSGKLFGAFQRLHATAEFEGTGIGLATVQRIVNRHGGRIWAEGEVEKGATFYVVL